MNFLKRLFGRGEAPRALDVVASDRPSWDFSGVRQEPQRQLSAPPQSDFPWRVSENGNPTGEIGNTRLTVFPDGNFWKYCLADATNPDAEPYFSPVYETEEAAKYEAIADLKGLLNKFKSYSERRSEERAKETTERLPSWMAKETENLKKVEASVARALASEKTTVKRLVNLQKQLEVRQRAAQSLLLQMIETDQPVHQERKAEAMRDRYFDLLEAVLKRKATASD